MKLLLLAFILAGAYTFVLLSSANQLVDSTERLHATYGRIADRADQWSAGDTSASFVSAR